LPLPQPITLTHFIDIHREEFVKFELWISEELTQHLIEAHNLDPAFTTVVVDMDEEEPVGKSVDSIVLLRLNGRFYMPLKDKQGVDLELTAEKWIESAKGWFDENEVEVTFDEDSNDLIKFTAFVPGVELPETEEPAAEEGAEEPADEGEEAADEEPAKEGEEGADEEPADEEPADEGEEGADEEGLKEFEDALGL